MSVKKLTTAAILAALSVVLLYLAAVLPTGRLALIAIAGLLPAAAVVSRGLDAGIYCYVVTALLALLLLPSKGTALVYIAIFGHYPVLKSLIERLHSLVWEWVLKLALFNALLTLCWLAFRALFLETMPAVLTTAALIYIAGNAAFVLYDICFSGLISAYSKLIKRIMK